MGKTVPYIKRGLFDIAIENIFSCFSFPNPTALIQSMASITSTHQGETLRVLFWCELFPPSNRGGVEMFGLQLIHELQRRGIEVKVVCDFGPEPVEAVAEYEGVCVHRFPIREALNTGNLARLKTSVQGINDIFRDWQPDLVHMNTLEPGVFAYLRATERKSCATVLTLHYAISNPLFSGKLQQQVINEADSVVAISDHIFGAFVDLFPKHESKAHKILNGLGMPFGKPAPMPDGPLKLFSAGLLCTEKGFDLVLDALAILDDPRIRWTLAGSGPEEKNLLDQCRNLGLTDRVEFLGRVSWAEVYEQIDQSHLVAVPSRWQEPFGLVALQALQRARPVVASARGGLPEIVDHGINGWLFDPVDAETLARQIGNCAGDLNPLKEMGKVGRLRAEKEFTIERMADQYLELFLQTLALKHGH